jgi:hypothetical protein
LRTALVTVECLAERKEKMKFRLPTGSPLANESGEYVLADLAAKVRDQALELSRRFDRRNGNAYYVNQVEEAVALRRFATRVLLNS